MEEKMAYIFEEYLIEFVEDEAQVKGEVFYPGEKAPVGKVTCHFYNYKNPQDTSHQKDDAMHIDILRVQANHEKKGLGTFMIKRVMEYADMKKVKHVTTTPTPTTRMSLEDLKKFYLKFRFGSAFLMKKIEFVDEEGLIADVLQSESGDSATSVKRVLEEDVNLTVDEAYDIVTNERVTKITKANRVGYLTVVHYLDRELPVKARVVQIGTAGAGIYATYLAKKGSNVVIVEPKLEEVENLKKTLEGTHNIEIYNKDFSYLYELPDECVDAVLCFGPMYSVLTLEEKERLIKEAYRICKKGGRVFISFMSNEMLVMERTFNSDFDFISGPKFDSITLKVVSSKKRLLTFEEIEVLFSMCGIKYSKRFAAEGMSMLIRDKMEKMNDKQFDTWMEYHYKICEKKEMLGCSNHVVYIVKKPV